MELDSLLKTMTLSLLVGLERLLEVNEREEKKEEDKEVSLSAWDCKPEVKRLGASSENVVIVRRESNPTRLEQLIRAIPVSTTTLAPLPTKMLCKTIDRLEEEEKEVTLVVDNVVEVDTLACKS